MKLLEQFTLELAHDKSKTSVSNCFKALREGIAENVFMSGATYSYELGKQDTPVGFASMSGMLFGITLCYTSDLPIVNDYLKGYIEHQKRLRGEHVVDIFQKKAGK